MKVLVVDPLKCSGGKSCELACSFHKTGRFNPADSLIKLQFVPRDRSYPNGLYAVQGRVLCPGLPDRRFNQAERRRRRIS